MYGILHYSFIHWACEIALVLLTLTLTCGGTARTLSWFVVSSTTHVELPDIVVPLYIGCRCLGASDVTLVRDVTESRLPLTVALRLVLVRDDVIGHVVGDVGRRLDGESSKFAAIHVDVNCWLLRRAISQPHVTSYRHVTLVFPV